MASPTASPYEAEYYAARDLYDTDLKGCIDAAEDNLLNPLLPPYFMVMNLVLIVSALDNWDDAEMFRLSAEKIYEETFEDATNSNDEGSLEALAELREELDALKRFKLEDMLGEHGFDYDRPFDSDSILGTENSRRTFWQEDSADENDDDEDMNNIGDDNVLEGAHEELSLELETKDLELPVHPGTLQNPTEVAGTAEAAPLTKRAEEKVVVVPK
ncbi:hypothetical protein EKO04_011404 [Ascochyta lentis]|uniref:Uncharacterized protein n=1 Tax=Ascochyta lentis TaxID=205686 RepID=A0A8H7IU65_9PLEO|nr:hypothetical protein EKO04_011404 [Ascochyta lentis]